MVAADANTLVSTIAKENLENTKYKILGGCFSVVFSSIFRMQLFRTGSGSGLVSNSYFRCADWRSIRSKFRDYE